MVFGFWNEIFTSPQGARGMINNITTYIIQSDSWNGHENNKG